MWKAALGVLALASAVEYVRSDSVFVACVAVVLGAAAVAPKALDTFQSWRLDSLRRALLAKHHDKDMVYLFCFRRIEGFLSNSPPCIKAETFFRIAKIPYTAVYLTNPAVSPTGRLPFVILNGKIIADSQAIIDCVQQELNLPPETSTAQEVAIGIALRRVCEESLRLNFYRHFWVDNCAYLYVKYAKVLRIPERLVRLIFSGLREEMIEWLDTHAIGDISAAQHQQEYIADVKTIEALIAQNGGSSGFCTGKSLSQFDASVFAWLYINVTDDQMPKCAGIEAARNSAVITAYMERVKAACYPDFASVVSLEETKVSTRTFKQAMMN